MAKFFLVDIDDRYVNLHAIKKTNDGSGVAKLRFTYAVASELPFKEQYVKYRKKQINREDSYLFTAMSWVIRVPEHKAVEFKLKYGDNISKEY